MSYPGEYVSPLPRTTFVQSFVTSGYTTVRLVSQDPVSGSSDQNHHQVTANNDGTTAFTFKLRSTDDISATGTRTDVSSSIALVPGGETVVNIAPSQRVLEVYCTAGAGNLRMSLVAKRRYQEMAFDRLDTFFPQTATQAKPTPVAPYI